jgi:hypothetical protein
MLLYYQLHLWMFCMCIVFVHLMKYNIDRMNRIVEKKKKTINHCCTFKNETFMIGVFERHLIKALTQCLVNQLKRGCMMIVTCGQFSSWYRWGIILCSNFIYNRSGWSMCSRTCRVPSKHLSHTLLFEYNVISANTL